MSAVSEKNTDDKPVLSEVVQGIGVLSLNKPARLNALSIDMFRVIYRQLCQWEDDDTVHAVVIKSTTDKAFCAGGDVKAAAKLAQQARQGKDHGQMVRDLFREEYMMNAKIASYPKPYIAFMNGIVMGGGIGIALHGTHRVMTETTKCAMPETKIGFFPDIGFGALYKNMPGLSGLYMAMTGSIVDAEDTKNLGFATHYVPQADWHTVIDAFISAGAGFKNVLIPYALKTRGVFAQQDKVDKYFDYNSVEKILKALEKDKDSDPWCAQMYQDILSRCPVSVKVAFRHFHTARAMDSFADIVKMDYRLSQNMAWRADFYEGVRALLIDKDMSPNWQPKHLHDVDDAEIEALFDVCMNGEPDLEIE